MSNNKKITDLEKFCLEHVLRPFQGMEWLEKISKGKRFEKMPFSMEILLEKLKEKSEWSEEVLGRICRIHLQKGLYFPNYINHPIKDFIEKKIKEYRGAIIKTKEDFKDKCFIVKESLSKKEFDEIATKFSKIYTQKECRGLRFESIEIHNSFCFCVDEFERVGNYPRTHLTPDCILEKEEITLEQFLKEIE